MARKIKQNKEIKGIRIGKRWHILSQFADDTTLYLQYDPIVLNQVVGTFALIEAQTGLKVSYDKTMVYRTGSIANTNAKIYTTKR